MDEKQEDCYQFLNTLDMMVLSYIYQNPMKAGMVSELKGRRDDHLGKK